MTPIQQHIAAIKAGLPATVGLVAVSKYHPIEQLQEAYDCGQRIFGENHAQELAAKAPQMPADVQWHFIGHLQTNKVRMIMPHVALIHSIDSVKLLRVVNKEAARIGRTADVLLQLHVAQEETKSGFAIAELKQALAEGMLDGMDNVRICGLMAMGSNVDDNEQVAREFELVHATFLELKRDHFAHSPAFAQLSMGMSDDWHLAVQHGSTLVRIGTQIFGPRQY